MLSSTKLAPGLGARASSTEKKHHAACSEHFWKLSSTKFAPYLRAKAIWKSKPLKHQVLGAVFEFNLRFSWQAQGFRHVAKYVAGTGVSEGCKIVGRRGEGLQISCHGSVTLQGFVAVTGVRMHRLNFFVAGAVLTVLLKHPLQNR